MQAIDFARAAKAERDALASSYGGTTTASAVSALLADAQLTEMQRQKVVAALDQAMTDAFYTMLLALDGAASLGGTQQSYRLISENGSPISNGDGRWKPPRSQFSNPRSQTLVMSAIRLPTLGTRHV